MPEDVSATKLRREGQSTGTDVEGEPRVHLLRGADHHPVLAPADLQEARRQAATHLEQLLHREPQLGAVLEVEHHAGEPRPHRPVNPVEAERPLHPVRPEILHVCHQCVLHGKVRRFCDRRDGLCRVNAAAVACGEDVLVDVETLVPEADADEAEVVAWSLGPGVYREGGRVGAGRSAWDVGTEPEECVGVALGGLGEAVGEPPAAARAKLHRERERRGAQ